VEQDRVAEGLCGSGEDEQLSIVREQLKAPDVALLDPADNRLAARKAEPAGQVGDVPRARQLEQGQRVAVTLHDDLIANGGIYGAGHVGQQQRASISVAEPADRQLGQPGQNVIASPRPRGADDRDPLGEQAAGHEPQDLRRGVVEPLRVVDDTGQRLLLGDLSEQGQRGQPHQEPVGRSAGAAAEHRRERVALRTRQPVEVVQHGRAELVESGVGQLHLRLDADGSRNMPASDLAGQVAQQRTLARPSLAPQDDDPAPAGEHVAHQPVERLTLAAASEELRGQARILTGRRPPGIIQRLLVAGLSRAYTAALSAMIKSLALDVAPVRVNVIAAGFVDTPLSVSLLGDRIDERREQIRTTLLIGRVVGPADIAALAVHLMTNTAVTGATFDIDGGQQLIDS
jgi:hypothetical protein